MDWFERFILFIFFPICVSGLVWLIVWSISLSSSEGSQEQKFANTFYIECQKDNGTYSIGQDGYVCFKNGTILFQTSSSHDSPK